MTDAFKSPMTTDEMIAVMRYSSNSDIQCARNRLIELSDEIERLRKIEAAAYRQGYMDSLDMFCLEYPESEHLEAEINEGYECFVRDTND